jgi:hypothetical protein
MDCVKQVVQFGRHLLGFFIGNHELLMRELLLIIAKSEFEKAWKKTLTGLI